MEYYQKMDMVNNYSSIKVTELMTIIPSFSAYLEEVKKKFKKFVIFVDRAA
ncbi:MAG: hypothetical protein M3Z01_08145 [Thermoproteota archaeon]|nr:hypothetical protein [Thermoproteota archaeon]